MPIFDYTKYDEDVEYANSSYGTDFSFANLDAQTEKLRGRSGVFAIKFSEPGLTIPDYVYRTTFLNLYRQALTNLQKGTIDHVDHSGFISSFSNLLLKYRKVHGDDDGYAPRVDGGWSDYETIYREMQKIANQFKSDKVEATRDAYDARKIRLRDMRAHVSSLENAEEIKVSDLSQIILYAETLQRKLDEPKSGWKAFVAWFRAPAERRDLAMLKTFIDKQKTENERLYEMADELAKERPLDYIKETLETHVNSKVNNNHNVEIDFGDDPDEDVYDDEIQNTNAIDNDLSNNIFQAPSTVPPGPSSVPPVPSTIPEVPSMQSEPEPVPVKDESVPAHQESVPSESKKEKIIVPEANIPSAPKRTFVKCSSKISAALEDVNFQKNALKLLNRSYNDTLSLEQTTINELYKLRNNLNFDMERINKTVIPENLRGITFRPCCEELTFFLQNMAQEYDNSARAEDDQGIREAMDNGVKSVFACVFKGIAGYGYPLRETILTAQKFTDEMLKQYSPVKYDYQNLKKYANNYAINCGKDFLYEVYMITCEEKSNLQWLPERSDIELEQRMPEIEDAFEKGYKDTYDMMRSIDSIHGNKDVDEHYDRFIHKHSSKPASRGKGGF